MSDELGSARERRALPFGEAEAEILADRRAAIAGAKILIGERERVVARERVVQAIESLGLQDGIRQRTGMRLPFFDHALRRGQLER